MRWRLRDATAGKMLPPLVTNLISAHLRVRIIIVNIDIEKVKGKKTKVNESKWLQVRLRELYRLFAVKFESLTL